MQLILDAACLTEVVLQHGDLLVALGVLLLQFALGTKVIGRDEDRPTARVDRSFPPGLDPERRISIIHFSVLPLVLLVLRNWL